MHRQTLSCGSLYDLASCRVPVQYAKGAAMSLLENVCGRLLVVAAIALWSAGTLAVDAIHAHAMFRQWRAASFFTTEGMIIESKAEATAGDGAAWEAKIRYEYFVEGRRYAANRYRYAYLGAAGSEAETQRLVEAHPVGGRATIYFNPRNPAEALLYPGVSSGDFLIGLFLAPFNIAMVGMGGGVALGLGGGWGLAPGGLRISERDAELRAQPPRIRSLSRAALAAFGVSLISTALVGVCAGLPPRRQRPSPRHGSPRPAPLAWHTHRPPPTIAISSSIACGRRSRCPARRSWRRRRRSAGAISSPFACMCRKSPARRARIAASIHVASAGRTRMAKSSRRHGDYRRTGRMPRSG